MPDPKAHCEVEELFRIIQGRWKVVLIRELEAGPKRHGQLMRSLHGITQKMLTQRLRELESDGIASRRDVLEGRVKQVEYSLTEWGASVMNVVMYIHHWAAANRHHLGQKHPDTDTVQPIKR